MKIKFSIVLLLFSLFAFDINKKDSVVKPLEKTNISQKRAFQFKVQVKSGDTINIYTDTKKYSYDFEVNWGDGSATQKNITGDVSHSFAKTGTLIVSINGLYPSISFNKSFNNKNTSIIAVTQWGDNKWQSMHEMFYNCTEFTDILAKDQPDLSQVEDMSGMFFGAKSFNQPLNNWGVSEVTNMKGMFAFATAFNQPLNNWDVSKVTDMAGMFMKAFAFNQPLSNWNVSKVSSMGVMFYEAHAFNQPLNNWDVSKVKNMIKMFREAKSFNQPLNNWDVSKVKNMKGMFTFAESFDQSLNNWDVSNVTNYDYFALQSNLECKNIPNEFDDKTKAGCKNP